MKEGDTITVKGNSLKGKSRVSQYGDKWKIVKTHPSVACLNNKPGVLLESVGGYQRWMSLEDDRDFSPL